MLPGLGEYISLCHAGSPQASSGDLSRSSSGYSRTEQVNLEPPQECRERWHSFHRDTEESCQGSPSSLSELCMVERRGHSLAQALVPSSFPALPAKSLFLPSQRCRESFGGAGSLMAWCLRLPQLPSSQGMARGKFSVAVGPLQKPFFLPILFFHTTPLAWAAHPQT